MSLKKVLTIGVACLGFSSAYAGGPDVAPACPVCPVTFVPYLYLGLSAGWAYSNWQDFVATGAPVDADTNGFTAGGKIGYQFSDFFGIEGGGFYLPQSDQSVTFYPQYANAFTLHGQIDSWFAYGAATIRAPLFDPFFHVSGKVGGAYRQLDHSGSLYNNVNDNDDDNNYATVIFGATLEYDLAPYHVPLTVGADYYYIPGSNSTFFKFNNNTNVTVNDGAAPPVQVVVGTLVFKFAV